MKTKLNKEQLDQLYKNSSCWKGPIYYNPQDPRMIVEKQSPFVGWKANIMWETNFGWTLNFGNPYTYIFLIILIGVLIAIPYFLDMKTN